MNFLYIDKANSLSEVRIAERSIWSDEIPHLGYKVLFLLKKVNRKKSNIVEVQDKNVFYVPFIRLRGISIVIFIFKLLYIVLFQKINVIVVRNTVDLALFAFFVSKVFSKKILYIKAYPYLEQKASLKKSNNLKNIIFLSFINTLLRLDTFIIKRCDYIIIRTTKYAEFLNIKYGINREMLPISMGIQNKNYDYLTSLRDFKQNSSIKNDSLTTIYFGTFDKSRKIEFVVNVIHKVVNANKDIKCYIIGGPQERLVSISNYVNDKGMIGYFKFIPTIQREKLFKYLKLADFSLSPIPPTEEYILSSPTKVVESIAMGCPVIGNYEIVDQKEIIEQSGGGYLLPYDENAFAEKIIELFDTKKELQKMGLEGSKFVFKNRNYTKLAKDILNYLNLPYSEVLRQ